MEGMFEDLYHRLVAVLEGKRAGGRTKTASPRSARKKRGMRWSASRMAPHSYKFPGLDARPLRAARAPTRRESFAHARLALSRAEAAPLLVDKLSSPTARQLVLPS
ncbi:MAG: hypothetical protein R3A78_09990 [Polyangiales bacterium]